ncbi:small ribosomal subunit protein eS12-like [Aotus nancymaae]|uniref:small ribosomal subunit protein eS12-like n=1 Tax=Aotus nancymaae TaxID=37293 RepID=UPI0030FEBC56
MVEEGIVANGIMDIHTALQKVMKTVFIYRSQEHGIHKAAKALVKHQASLCVLASNCNEPMYVKLVDVLSAEHQINLIKADDKKLRTWVVLCKTDRENTWKVIGCSCVVFKDYGKEAQAKDDIEKYFRSKKWTKKALAHS